MEDNKNDKPTFHLDYKYQEDTERELREAIANLKEKQKTDFKFGNEYFYHVGGGHDFVHGFFNKYVTKKGVTATQYSRYWVINGEDYDYKNDVFIKRPVIVYEPTKIKFEDIQFPVIKNISAKTIAQDLPTVHPKRQL
jgi:hypothetical protein